MNHFVPEKIGDEIFYFKVQYLSNERCIDIVTVGHN